VAPSSAMRSESDDLDERCTGRAVDRHAAVPNGRPVPNAAMTTAFFEPARAPRTSPASARATSNRPSDRSASPTSPKGPELPTG
jgi:hypothetical protein